MRMVLPPVYTDQRTHEYQGPPRFVCHPRACAIGGGAFAISKDGSRCVVAGNEVLRILRIRDPSLAQSHVGESGSRIAVGPGGSTIEISPNMWSASGLKVDSAPTDVIWAHGVFDHKIITSARNGEIIYWDLNKSGSKYDYRIKEHTRAVNKLALSPSLPYLFASGAQDGYLRVWDLRSPLNSTTRVYHATGIRAISFCPVQSHPYHVCVGLESGNLQRWDLRHKAQPLERITLAHSSAILSMDWQLPNMAETGLGWIVTSGMDRRVKVWDLTQSTIVSNAVINTSGKVGSTSSDSYKAQFTKKMGPHPFRVLHTPFPVRNVSWRPGNDTEVGIISNNDNDNDTVEIWDVRRGWIGKWVLDGVDSAITDFAFPSSHKIWAQHVNGAFVQHDLRDCLRPLDAISRVSVTWAADGSMAFVGNHKPEIEVPYDDIDPHYTGSNAGRVRPKTTSDPLYVPYDEQVLGVVHGANPDPNLSVTLLERLAKAYVLDGDPRKACEHNAEAAAALGHFTAAQTWRLLYTLLLDIGPDAAESELLHMAPPSSANVYPTNTSNLNSAPASLRTPSVKSDRKAPQSNIQNHSPNNTRHSSPSPRPSPLPLPMSSVQHSHSYSHQYSQSQSTTSSHSHSSTRNKSNTPDISPLSLKYDASTSSRASSTFSQLSSHRARTATVTNHPSPNAAIPDALGAPSSILLRRASVSTPPTPANLSSDVQRVGEGALDDSDSSEEEEEAAEEDLLEEEDAPAEEIQEHESARLVGVDDSTHIFSEPISNSNSGAGAGHMRWVAAKSRATANAGVSNIGRGRRKHIPSPSPLSRMVASRADREASPDGHLASDERSAGDWEDDGDEADSEHELEGGTSWHGDVTKLEGRRSDTEDVDRELGNGKMKIMLGSKRRGSDSTSTSTTTASTSTSSAAWSSTSSQQRPARVPLAKQESQISIKTVTAEPHHATELSYLSHGHLPDVPPEGLTSGGEVSLKGDAHRGSSMPTRRVSPMQPLTPSHSTRHGHHPSITSTNAGGGLALSLSTHAPAGLNAGASSVHPSHVSHSHSLSQSVRANSITYSQSQPYLRPPIAAHRDAAATYKALAWNALDEMLERYAEDGDILMCAGLVCVAPRRGERTSKRDQDDRDRGDFNGRRLGKDDCMWQWEWGLSVGDERAVRIVEAYIDLLEHLQFHALAAHVRKTVPFGSVRDATQTQTTFYTSCGACGRSIRTSAGTSGTALSTIAAVNVRAAAASGAVLCDECKSRPTICVICHIPVRRLLILCPTCGHGGHERCLRDFYTARKAFGSVDVLLPALPALPSGAPPSTSPAVAGAATDSTSLSDRETVYFSWSDGDGPIGHPYPHMPGQASPTVQTHAPMHAHGKSASMPGGITTLGLANVAVSSTTAVAGAVGATSAVPIAVGVSPSSISTTATSSASAVTTANVEDSTISGLGLRPGLSPKSNPSPPGIIGVLTSKEDSSPSLIASSSESGSGGSAGDSVGILNPSSSIEREGDMESGTTASGPGSGPKQGLGKLRVIGYPCASGCGHWCWAAGEKPAVNA